MSNNQFGFERIVLGSTSPFRKALLDKLHIPFECAKPNCDESLLNDESPQQLVDRLSFLKAQSLNEQFPNSLIIASDQVAVCENIILGKPGNHKKAAEQLTFLSGKSVQFITGLCLFNSTNQTHQLDIDTFQVQFRKLSSNQIENYLTIEQPYNCAGSFKSEALGISLFHSMIGNDPNALIGLPLIKLVDMLANEGIELPMKKLT